MIKIFLIKNQKIVREELKVLLEEESDLRVYVSENKDVKLSLINHLQSDLLLISLSDLARAYFDYFKDLLCSRSRYSFFKSDSKNGIVQGEIMPIKAP